MSQTIAFLVFLLTTHVLAVGNLDSSSVDLEIAKYGLNL